MFQLQEALTLFEDLADNEAADYARRVVFYTLSLQHNNIVFDKEVSKLCMLVFSISDFKQ